MAYEDTPTCAHDLDPLEKKNVEIYIGKLSNKYKYFSISQIVAITDL